MTLIGLALLWLLRLAIWLLVARALVSWVPLLFPRFRPRGALAAVFSFIYKVTEPPLHWLRRYVRPLPLGGAALDLSFMVWFILLLVAQRMVVMIFF